MLCYVKGMVSESRVRRMRTVLCFPTYVKLCVCSVCFFVVVFFQSSIPITRLCKILRFFTAVKMVIFRRKSVAFFLIFAQNIDCVYTLGPHR